MPLELLVLKEETTGKLPMSKWVKSSTGESAEEVFEKRRLGGVNVKLPFAPVLYVNFFNLE